MIEQTLLEEITTSLCLKESDSKTEVPITFSSQKYSLFTVSSSDYNIPVLYHIEDKAI